MTLVEQFDETMSHQKGKVKQDIMSDESPLPGSATHQTLLKLFIAIYERRDDVLAALVFGSLGKGTWDEHSDLDLAVVVQDNVQIDLQVELERVRAAFAQQGEPPLFVEIAGDECFLVLRSLTCVAIRYHSVESTSPYVREGCRVLCGRLDVATIYAAAKANEPTGGPTFDQQIHRALWLALSVDTAVQRRQFWRGLQGLERMQAVLLEIFATSRNGKRIHQVFEQEAGATMQALFGLTLPQYFPDSTAHSLHSLGAALIALLDLLEHHLAELSNHQATLGAGEREVIAQLRTRRQVQRYDAV